MAHSPNRSANKDRDDFIQGMDLVQATLHPTKKDHFFALLSHNAKVTLRKPSVYIFGALIPLIMIGAAIGISLGIQSGIPKVVAGDIGNRVIDLTSTGVNPVLSAGPPAIYFPVVQSTPSLNPLSQAVVNSFQTLLLGLSPVFSNFSSMDDVVTYVRDTSSASLQNQTLKNLMPQVGFELDSFQASTGTPGTADLGYSIMYKDEKSVPIMIGSMDRFLQNADTNASVPAAADGINFVTTLNSFPAQASENVDISSFIVPAFMTFAFSFFTSFVATNLVVEKELGQKAHLQSMGIKPSTYYFARFAIDMGFYLVPVVACFVMMGALKLQMITSGSWVPYLFLLVVSGLPFISIGYLLSLFFQKSQSVGQVLGVSLSIVVFVPYFFVQFVFDGASLLAIILIGFISPPFALERSISAIALAQTTGSPYSVGDTFDINKAPFVCMIMFIVQTIIYFVLIFWVENLIQTRRSPVDYFFRKGPSKVVAAATAEQQQAAEAAAVAQTGRQGTGLSRQDTSILVEGKYRGRDAEVLEETIRLQNSIQNPDENDAIRLLSLSKSYTLADKKRQLIILDNIYLSFKKRECFGYLGPNGAGKTTTIKILTGQESPTSGTGTMNGLSIVPFHPDLRAMIGICPQFDVLWPEMTAAEHLVLFAKIKGVAPKDINPAVEQMIDEMGLRELGRKKAKTFSGGNKRRLSLAMAVIGAPKIVFLDEPTTGVDVGIRQAIWNAIRKLKQTSCVILTTHSMEEADALCDRIGIITNGHIQALGTSQRLKNTYGAGYKVIVKTRDARQNSAVTAALERAVGDPSRVSLVQTLGVNMEYELTRLVDERTTDMLSRVFAVFEQNRQELGIEDYSVSQTTLAQVFIEFAKEQATEKTDHH